MSWFMSGPDWMRPRRCMRKRKKLQATKCFIIRIQQPSWEKSGSMVGGQDSEDSQPGGYTAVTAIG